MIDAPAGDRLARRLRGFGPIGILAMLVVLAGNLLVAPLSAILALVWARWSRTPWRDIGYVRPASWVRGALVGIVFGGAFKLAMKMLVTPLMSSDPINHAYHYLVGNTAALPWMLYVVIVGAGFGEETIFRGYLFERLGRLFGRSAWATVAIVLLTSTLFGLAHYHDQGIVGAGQATVVGLVFGGIYAVTGSLWMLMWAHASFDVTAVAIIYWNLESRVAHVIFH